MKITESEKRTLKLFKLLSNSTRFMIIKILKKQDRNVTTLAELTNKEGSTISKHLRLLSDLDIVSFRTKQNQVIYSLKKKEVLELITDAMKCMERNKK
jgi:ArsR family transcriptional regulator